MLGHFKELRMVRWPILFEAMFCALLFVVLGKHYGVTGIILANVASAAFGSLWFGAGAMSRLSGMPLRAMAGVLVRTLIPPCVVLAVIASFYRPPLSLDGLPVLLLISLGWIFVATCHFWWFALDSSEHAHIRRLLSSFWKSPPPVIPSDA
jgi:hypothetical protein